MEEQLSFMATLAGTNTSSRWLSVGSDGDGKIVFETPGSELHKLFNLAHYSGQVLRVTVEVA